MKEAIKVQSVTIIIINGISESFQSVRRVMQKAQEIPAVGARVLAGKTRQEPVCGRDGSGADGGRDGERAPLGTGAGGEMAHAGDAGRSARTAAARAKWKAAQDQISSWAPEHSAPLGVLFVFVLLGHIL